MPFDVQTAEFDIPYPPSVNHIYMRTKKGTVVRSPQYIKFIKSVFGIVYGTRLVKASRYRVDIELFPPDNRKRDIDNILKGTFDALTHCGLWRDDKLIVELHMYKREPEKNHGRLHIVATSLL